MINKIIVLFSMFLSCQIFANEMAERVNLKLKSCEMVEKDLVCVVSVKSIEDLSFYVYVDKYAYATRIIDFNGDEYFPNIIYLGGKNATYDYVWNRLVEGVPLNIKLKFNNFPEGVTAVRLLEMPTSVNTIKEKPDNLVRFRNFEIK